MITFIDITESILYIRIKKKTESDRGTNPNSTEKERAI